MHFGLDTGLSVGSSVTPENAEKLGLPVTEHHTIHSSDRQEVPGMTTDTVRATTRIVAGHTFRGPEGVIMPDAHRDGTLSIALFRDVLLTLDFPHDRLSIADGALPLPNGHDVIAYTTGSEADATTPIVKIQLAGRTLPALLDTGAHGLNADVIVPTRVAATLPLGPTESTITVSDAMGNKFPSHIARLTGDMFLGKVVLHNPTVLVSDWLGFSDLARVSNLLVLTSINAIVACESLCRMVRLLRRSDRGAEIAYRPTHVRITPTPWKPGMLLSSQACLESHGSGEAIKGDRPAMLTFEESSPFPS